jgi:hypothetical protein
MTPNGEARWRRLQRDPDRVSVRGVFAASAGAKTVTVGQLFMPNATCVVGFTRLQSGVASGRSYSVQKAGVITSWSFEDGSLIASGLKLKVGRRSGGGI